MKSRINGLLLSLAVMGAPAVSHAMSSLVSLGSEPVWPATSTPDGNVVYNVTTVARAGSGMLEVTLTAGAMPPGVTVTFSPSVLRFTGNQLSSQTAKMTVSCPYPIPLDCYPFTITGTSQRESISVTNKVCLTPSAVAVRPPTLYLDSLTNSALRIRGLAATAKTYQIEASPSLSSPTWTLVGSATADGNGRFTSFTSLNTGAPARFFRAVTPQ
jgi:hypothetical protein